MLASEQEEGWWEEATVTAGPHSPPIRRSNEGSRDSGDNGVAASTKGHVEARSVNDVTVPGHQ